jgi:DNA ligase-1
MKDFARLFYDLDQTNKTNEKVDILAGYFKKVSEEEIMHMLALFTGRRPKRVVNSAFLRTWAAEKAGIPMWLLEESYAAVGDFSETIALLLPNTKTENNQPLGFWVKYVMDLAKKTEAERKEAIFTAWDQLNKQERFVFNKITSSTFRVGVSQNLVLRALSVYTQIPGNVLAHRLMGKWDPINFTYHDLLGTENAKDDLSKPYPFYLAHPIEDTVETLGTPAEWQAEWKWDGIRSQIIMRNGHIFVWSRGEELVTDKFPELEALKNVLPDGTVIDGEILPYADGKLLGFNILQTRIGRKNITPKILKEAPVVVYAYDLLEWQGEDIREKPMQERQKLLEKLVNDVNYKPVLQLSPKIAFETWEEVAQKRLLARENISEGLMLKRKNSPYQVGRKRGDWWKWKIDPLSVDAVMIYAMKGSGRRANLYTDYTFGIWKGQELVSFAKAYSGLTDKEILEVDKWIRKNMVEKFGPVVTVKPELVFEIGFEGIQRSNRHKSGVALRFPRMLRWRLDKPIAEADSIETVLGILEGYEKGSGE